MSTVDRLISAGMDAESAFEVALWFAAYGNESDKERFVLEYERGQRQRPNDG